jgi:hypothetical protein
MQTEQELRVAEKPSYNEYAHGHRATRDPRLARQNYLDAPSGIDSCAGLDAIDSCAGLDPIVRFVSLGKTPSLGKDGAVLLGIMGGILNLGHINQRIAPCHRSEKRLSETGVAISRVDQPLCRDHRSLFAVDWIPS